MSFERENDYQNHSLMKRLKSEKGYFYRPFFALYQLF